MNAEERFISRHLDRRTLFRLGGAGAVVLGAGGLLSGCSSSDTVVGRATSASGPPQDGGTLNIAMLGGLGDSYNPANAPSSVDIALIRALHARLFLPGPDLKPLPWLAESAESSPDGMIWTVKLRDGVTWHDGKDLVAEDLLNTIRGWADPGTSAHGSTSQLIDYGNARKVDDRTVAIAMLQPVAQLPAILLNRFFAVVRGTDAEAARIGLGPFKLDTFQAGKQAKFSAFRDYFADGPFLDGLQFDLSYSDEAARVNAVTSGTVDVAPQTSYPLAKANEANPAVVILNNPSPSFLSFTMRVDRPPYNDVRVRQAMRLIANRKQMVETAVLGYGNVGNDLPAAGTQYFASDLTREQDLDQAKSLLKAAGAEGATFTINTTTYAGFLEAATIFQRNASEAGIKVELKRGPADNYYTATAGWPNYPFGQTRHTGDLSLTSEYLAGLVTGCGAPETGWGDPTSDRLVFDAIAESDPARAQEKWHAVQELQFEQGGNLIWANINNVDAASPKIGGFVDRARNGPLNGYAFEKLWKQP